MWVFPLPNKIVGVTKDSQSFVHLDLSRETEIPLPPHVGSFGHVRTFHTHEGVDLYANPGDHVVAVQDSIILNIIPFTGEHARSPWWENTWAVLALGSSGTICYGEITPHPTLTIGQSLVAGQLIGKVKSVLKKDKGRPMSMLHLEAYRGSSIKPICLDHINGQVADISKTQLYDPTQNLLDSLSQISHSTRFIKTEEGFINVDSISMVDASNIEDLRITIHHENGISELKDIMAIDACMILKPSVLESRRLKWLRHAWWKHNLIGHPMMQILAFFGKYTAAMRMHDDTVPRPTGRK